MKTRRKKGYEFASGYHVSAAWRLFAELEKNEIRFVFEPVGFIANQDPVTAKNGGTFGSGAWVHVYVKPDDLSKFRDIDMRLFTKQEDHDNDWRKRLREGH